MRTAEQGGVTRAGTFIGIFLVLCSTALFAANGLLSHKREHSLVRELSGVRAKGYIARIAVLDRTNADGYKAAMQQLSADLEAFGLSDIHIESYDGSAAQMNFEPKHVSWWPPYGWRVRKARNIAS